jgi:hypothetical protein
MYRSIKLTSEALICQEYFFPNSSNYSGEYENTNYNPDNNDDSYGTQLLCFRLKSYMPSKKETYVKVIR